MKKLILIVVVLITFISCKEEISSKEVSNPIEYSMDNSAKQFLENPEIKSISIGIYKDGKTYTNYYGEIDEGKGNKPNDNSIFEIASVTKTFTGILTAQAVIDGKISLEDDIRKYLEGSYPNLEYENRPILIKDILTHTTGIRRDLSETLGSIFSMDATEEEKKSIADYNRSNLITDLKKFKLDASPGTTHNYSPIVTAEILAMILEKVYQKSYSVLLEQYIFREAKMEHTSMQVKSEDEKHLVNGYRDDGQSVKPLYIPMSGAGGGLKSTIPDMLKYIEYLLTNKNPALEEMKKPLFYYEEDDEQFGYFWKLSDDDFMHSGGTNGSTNWLILLPEHNSGFFVMFNSNGRKLNRLINGIASSIYNDLENYPVKNVYLPIRTAIIENPENGILFYKQLKKDSPTEYNFNDESMLNRIGYELLGQEKNEEAIKVFQLLVSEFPESANPYDSLGEAYFINEQYDLSLANYKITLELNPKSGTAKKMIEKIEGIKK
jgi:CubicO group peptidase (beta-lactamase class C family)